MASRPISLSSPPRTVPEQRYGIGLFVVEADMPGFKRGNRLHKMGLRAQDTSELFFDNDTLNCPGCGCLGKNADHTLRQKRCGAGGGHALLSTSSLIVPRRDAGRSVNP